MKYATLVLGLFAMACRGVGSERGAPMRTGAPESSVVAQPAPGGAGDSNYRTQACRELLARYRKVLKAGSGTCRHSIDCVRYGGVDPNAVCGGATDVTTAQTLGQVRLDMDDAGCMALPYSCDTARPTCVAGHCGT